MRSFRYFAIGGCTEFGVEHSIYFVIFNIKLLFIQYNQLLYGLI